MTWVKVDDQFPDHPKMVGLSDGALACWLRGLTYCSRYLTDGAIPKAALHRLTGDPAVVDELLASECWQETASGWEVVGYLEHQRSSVQIEAERTRQRENKAKARAGRGAGKPAPLDSTETTAGVRRESRGTLSGVPRPELETELEREKEKTTSPLAGSTAGEADAEFERFWQSYPRRTDGAKGAKKAALKRWLRLSVADRAAVVAALPNYAQSDMPRRGYAMDCSRWIGPDECWREWVNAPTGWVPPTEGSRGISEYGEDMEYRNGAWWILRDGQRIRVEQGPVPA